MDGCVCGWVGVGWGRGGGGGWSDSRGSSRDAGGRRRHMKPVTECVTEETSKEQQLQDDLNELSVKGQQQARGPA